MVRHVLKGLEFLSIRFVRMLANGDEIKDLLKEYPSLRRDDILSCLDYVASLLYASDNQIDKKSTNASFMQ